MSAKASFMFKNLLSFLFCAAVFPGQNVIAQSLTAVRSAEGIEISEGSSKVLFYQIIPKSLHGKYERANYVHPLYGLNGEVLTEDFPDDHPHHHGIFWSWHQIIHEDERIADGWTSENISWEVVEAKILRRKEKISLNNHVIWSSALQGGQPQPIVREDSKITVHSVTAGYRIIDFDIRLAPLVEHIKIGGSDDEKGYGGFSWRIRLPDDIRFLSDGKEVEAQTMAVDAGPWLDFQGSFAGDGHPKSGIAIFSHPDNPGHPQPWILREKKSMQNLAFPGTKAVDIPDEGLRLRYRMVIHDIKVDRSDLEKIFQDYKK